MKIEKIEDLEIWRESILFSKNAYLLVNTKIIKLDKEMSAQIRRALISISSNIWEDFGRKTNKDFIKFLSYTLWSLNEVKTQFYLSYMLGYITKEELNKILSEATELIKKTKWFMSYLNKTSF